METTMTRSIDRVTDILSHVKYLNYQFYVGIDGSHMYLQVRFPAICTKENIVQPMHCRKWHISEHMTNSEIVQTSFKAVLTAVEHEAREHFTYRDQAIFGPHLDIDFLANALSVHSDDVQDVRYLA